MLPLDIVTNLASDDLEQLKQCGLIVEYRYVEEYFEPFDVIVTTIELDFANGQTLQIRSCPTSDPQSPTLIPWLIKKKIEHEQEQKQ
jgi:hypothetical protein